MDDTTWNCLYCGKEHPYIPDTPCQKFCNMKCYLAYRKHKPPPTPKAKSPPRKSLEQWAREADECNLDYGNYRALIDAGKTYAELRASADSRIPPLHARNKHTWY